MVHLLLIIKKLSFDRTIHLWNIKLAQTPPSQDTNSHLGRVEPRIFISYAQRYSCLGNVGFESRKI